MTPAAVEVCERLAALLRAGYSIPSAVAELPDRLDDELRGAARRAAGRLSLGAGLRHSLTPLRDVIGDDVDRLSSCLELSFTTGADAAAGLDDLAHSLRARDASLRSADAAGAAATLSARMIAALPLVMLPFSIRGAGLRSPAVAASIGLGIVIGFMGYRWLRKLIPPAPATDPVAAFCEPVAAALRSGVPLADALRAAAGASPAIEAEVRKALARAELGQTWTDAFTSAGLLDIARAIEDAERTGTPIAGSLTVTAASRAEAAQQRFEEQTKRAPVKMVVPLAVCVLPSFVLVAIVPLIHGLDTSV